MTSLASALQPTVRNLLATEALADARVLFGENLLERPIIQVVSIVNPPPRAGSLVVVRMELLTGKEPPQIKGLSGVVIVQPTSTETQPPVSAAAQSKGGTTVAGGGAVQPMSDAALKRIVKLCSEAETPLIVVPSFGEPGQTAEDIRLAYLRELKLNSSRLQAMLLSTVLEEGIEGLIEEVSTMLNRPVAVETADFKVLGAKNMGATPPAQQSSLSEAAVDSLKGRSEEKELRPLRIGRRLVLPVVLGESLVGYISVMVRPTDDVDEISECLGPAALAVMVDFSHRLKDSPGFSVTQKTLLKDLLSGRGLSAADQERVERHFGFDLCDGLCVFAIQATAPPQPSEKAPTWGEDAYISVEAEGTRVFVVPYHAKKGNWQQQADALVKKLKDECGQLRIQLGAARVVETMLDLPEAYREARQALIIGSMIKGDADFVIGYGDLGVKRLLYLMIDHPELDRFYEENLEPLEAYDVEWESELVSSLRVYLEHGANLNSAARALFIHRHTLRYRLEQIADILKVDIDSQEVLLNLQIAFLIMDMKKDYKGKM